MFIRHGQFEAISPSQCRYDGCDPLAKPTNTRVPAISLCLNARRNHLGVRSILDLSPEFNLIASRWHERKRLSLGFHGRVLYRCPSGPPTEPGKSQMEYVS